MASRNSEEVKKDIIKEFEKRNPKSKKLFEKALKYLPGGGTRNIAYFPPYPFFIDRGEGYYLYDVDGNQYLDVQNNMTVLLHGHGHPKITEALEKQAKRGTAHSAPLESQYKLAKILCDRVPSIEEIRFCNSGTEATMFTIRAARGFTGKRGLIKAEGGYHGSHDYVMINMDPDLTAEGMPTPFVERGISETLLQDVFVVPFNDLAAVEKIMKKHHKKIAAFILEPVMGYGGAAEATLEYMKGLRELCTKYEILLIFDEVITLRVATGGIQEMSGVIPDLTALGKTIGGGLPIGAFGGRREIMEQFSPLKKGYIMHSGTFSGNALSMVAGIAALELYDEAAIKKLDVLGLRLREGLKKIMAELGVKCNVGGIQSIAFIQFPDGVPMNKQQVVFNTIPFLELSEYLQVALALQGLYVISRGVTGFMLSTIMDEAIVDEILVRFRKAMEMVLPLYEEVKPYEGFSGIIYTLLKQLNKNKEFAEKYKLDDYSLLLVAKDDTTAVKVIIKDGKLAFHPIKNTKENIRKEKKECHGAIITTKPGFFGLVLGKAKPVKAILTGKLKIKGIKYLLKFTKYFGLLKGL
ncbi:MAG: aminotransferase class III-fold pyridoxal phosphate-dependent enzyme [Asgard group archaeon]|nr:aminotransferase class III-fold pyridoxal phosphate-dependent enzyme [Asgard group archaeon]